MKQRIIRISIFIFTFVISTVILSTIMNKGNTDMTVEMSAATFPVINMQVGGIAVNTLYGYADEMQEKYLRETLTPMGEDKALRMEIQKNGMNLTGISYEVRSLDTTRLVEKTELFNYIDDGGKITVDFSLKDLIDKDREYLLVIVLNTGSSEIRYYTRVRESDELDPIARLDFIRDFHDKTFDREAAKNIVTYHESNEEGDNSTYGHVDIHSSFYQITWGDLKIKERGEAVAQIYEMNDDISSVGLFYNLKTDGEEEDEDYFVRESYRIRYTPERIYLLDFDRTMDRAFGVDTPQIVNDKIVLGITDKEIGISENTEGTSVVFDQSNALYEYKNSEGILSRLFSFYDDQNWDIRTINPRHGIKVLSVDEMGNVYFMVYGYMNRGRHEGGVGVSVYYYDSARNFIEEKIYIPYKKSWEMLKEDVELLSYVNRSSNVYLYLDQSIYCIDLDGGDETVIAEDLGRDLLVCAKSNQVIAWGNKEMSAITLMDLNSGKSRDIRDEKGRRVHPVGFLGDDVVYGISDASTPRLRVNDDTPLMHTIKIEDKNGTELKSYSQDGIYVIETSVNNVTLHMDRVRYIEATGEYVSVADDQIMDNEKESGTKNNLTRVITENRETVTQIALVNTVSSKVKLQIPKEVLTEGGRSLNINNTENRNAFYVYAGGVFRGTWYEAGDAVKEASELSGVVIDDDQNYVWQKGSRTLRHEIKGPDFKDETKEAGVTDMAMCISAVCEKYDSALVVQRLLDSGRTPASLLSADEDAPGALVLSGCDLQSVLYYVGKDVPVIALVPGKGAVVIVGYDEKNTIILDPATHSRYKKGMNDSTAWFGDAGNEFITCQYSPFL
ncbi:MAG: hypothetical protein IKR68_03510 [Lachnospiraceae bacterium]|nr:hypothetical protein [Lachnospiraceae bacterium]